MGRCRPEPRFAWFSWLAGWLATAGCTDDAHLVGCAQLLELLVGLGVIGVLVRVALHPGRQGGRQAGTFPQREQCYVLYDL
jgi:hypothetical protein